MEIQYIPTLIRGTVVTPNPPTPLLRAFEACSRHLNVSRAAEELKTEQVALAVKVPSSSPAGISCSSACDSPHLNAGGAGYASDIRVALSHIESATQTLLASPGWGGTLTIAVSLLSELDGLMPRMRRLFALPASIMVNLLNSARCVPMDFAAEHVDCCHIFGLWPRARHRWPTASCRRTSCRVCSPSLLRRDG